MTSIFANIHNQNKECYNLGISIINWIDLAHAKI